MSKPQFPNERAFKQRLDFHLFAAAIWGQLAKDTQAMLSKETWETTRIRQEAFIQRAIGRALRHFREADAVRRRGHK